MKSLIIVLVLVAWTQPAPAVEASSPRIEHYVPAGWSATQTVEGDLNGDGAADLAAVLLLGETGNGTPAAEQGVRGLLVLFADPVDGYRVQGFAPGALPCADCLGALGGGPEAPVFELTIAGQRLTVGWLRGSREMVEVKLAFGYDTDRGAMRLLTDETLVTDRLTGDSSRRFRDYQAGTENLDGLEARSASRFIPLSEVSAEDY